ncbi:unnamed protein product, partial [Amoebophrya sp. A25]|eukprot:GSA25T00017481001.1
MDLISHISPSVVRDASGETRVKPLTTISEAEIEDPASSPDRPASHDIHAKQDSKETSSSTSPLSVSSDELSLSDEEQRKPASGLAERVEESVGSGRARGLADATRDGCCRGDGIDQE